MAVKCSFPFWQPYARLPFCGYSSLFLLSLPPPAFFLWWYGRFCGMLYKEEYWLSVFPPYRLQAAAPCPKYPAADESGLPLHWTPHPQ